MPGRNRAYEQFGPYVLFKKLESDALTDLWRAARIEGDLLGPLVALRRFHAGNRSALVAAAQAAREAASLLNGTSFVKTQTIDVIDNTPFIAHDYSGGRSLHHVVERARGGNGLTPNPIPVDQAILIAEKVALSLATSAELHYGGARLLHGALIPHFVWISDDGEIRVGGQMLGPGLVASLRDGKVGAEIGRYFSPEYQSSGTPSHSSEVYALGAMLYLLVTGQEPPDPVSGSAFTLTIRSARAMGGAPIPNDIRTIIEKSLALDPAARYATAADMKQELSALAHGKYTGTTFNLAVYLSMLLKKELEGEAIDREKESKVSAAPYVAAFAAAKAAPAATASPASRRRLPLALAAAIGGVAVLGIGAYFIAGPKQDAQPVRSVAAAAMVPPSKPKPAPVIPEPIVVAPGAASTDATATTATVAAVTTTDDEAARKKAFEAAVKQRMQEEMMKLQAQYTRELQKQQSKNAPILTASAIAPALQQQQLPAEDHSLSAAQLDQQRLVERQDTAPQQVMPQQTASEAQTQTVAPPQPVVPSIREGDVVDIADVDTAPRPLKAIHPAPPPIAIRQHVQGSVILTAFISEDGTVLDAKILSGITKFGVDDAALRAVRVARFSPAVKDGKRVRVWMPLRFDFKL